MSNPGPTPGGVADHRFADPGTARRAGTGPGPGPAADRLGQPVGPPGRCPGRSASMSARRLPAGGRVKTFRELVIEHLDRRLRDLPQGSVVTLIETGRRPTPALWTAGARHRGDRVAAGMGSPGSWSRCATGLEPGDHLGRRDRPVVVLTDTLPDPERLNLPTGMEAVSMGEPQPNLAITAARWMMPAEATGRWRRRNRPPQAAQPRPGSGHREVDRDNAGRRGDADRSRAFARSGCRGGPAFLSGRSGRPGGARYPDRQRSRRAGTRQSCATDRADSQEVRVAVSLPAESVGRKQVGRALLALADWVPSGLAMPTW
ncbi:MAG: hypothetical protein Ct9H300mP1_13830 [Planctomycetaceae bacterium]|nr:MAG: hypothetical protein Ct9H300mP1_13830 [Planctomycetaceae bacterium]